MKKILHVLLITIISLSIIGCEKKEDSPNKNEVIDENKDLTFEEIRQILYDNEVLWSSKSVSSGRSVQFRFIAEQERSRYAYFRMSFYDDGEIMFMYYQNLADDVYTHGAYIELHENFIANTEAAGSGTPKLNEEAIIAAEEFLKDYKLTIKDLKLVGTTHFLERMKPDSE